MSSISRFDASSPASAANADTEARAANASGALSASPAQSAAMTDDARKALARFVRGTPSKAGQALAAQINELKRKYDEGGQKTIEATKAMLEAVAVHSAAIGAAIDLLPWEAMGNPELDFDPEQAMGAARVIASADIPREIKTLLSSTLAAASKERQGFTQVWLASLSFGDIEMGDARRLARSPLPDVRAAGLLHLAALAKNGTHLVPSEERDLVRQGVQAASREVQKAALVYAEAATLSQIDCGELAGIAARLMSPKPDEVPEQQIDPRSIAKLYVKAQPSRDVLQSFFQRCFSETSATQHEAALEAVAWFASDPKLVELAFDASVRAYPPTVGRVCGLLATSGLDVATCKRFADLATRLATEPAKVLTELGHDSGGSTQDELDSTAVHVAKPLLRAFEKAPEVQKAIAEKLLAGCDGVVEVALHGAAPIIADGEKLAARLEEWLASKVATREVGATWAVIDLKDEALRDRLLQKVFSGSTSTEAKGLAGQALIRRQKGDPVQYLLGLCDRADKAVLVPDIAQQVELTAAQAAAIAGRLAQSTDPQVLARLVASHLAQHVPDATLRAWVRSDAHVQLACNALLALAPRDRAAALAGVKRLVKRVEKEDLPQIVGALLGLIATMELGDDVRLDLFGRVIDRIRDSESVGTAIQAAVMSPPGVAPRMARRVQKFLLAAEGDEKLGPVVEQQAVPRSLADKFAALVTGAAQSDAGELDAAAAAIAEGKTPVTLDQNVAALAAAVAKSPSDARALIKEMVANGDPRDAQALLADALRLEAGRTVPLAEAAALSAAASSAKGLIEPVKPVQMVMVEGVALPRHPLADSGDRLIPPLADARLVDTDTALANRRRLAEAMALDLNLWLEGPTSAGKTDHVREIFAMLGWPLRVFSCNAYTSLDELLGMAIPDRDDPTKGHMKMGPVLLAATRKHGEGLLLDEVDLLRESIRMKLNTFVTHRTIRWPGFNEGKPIKADPGFRLLLASNGVGMTGRETSSPAFRRRFVKVLFEGLTHADISKITSERFPRIPTDMVAALSTLHMSLAEMAEKDGIGGAELNYSFTLRTLKRACALFEKYRPGSGAIATREDWIALRREVEDAYMAVVYDEGDRNKVKSLIDLTFAQDDLGEPRASAEDVAASRGLVDNPARPGTVKLEKTKTGYKLGYVELTRLPGERSDVPDIDLDDVVLVPSRAVALQRMMKCAEMGFPHFLVGDGGAGKTFLVSALAAMRNQGLYDDVFDESTDPSILVAVPVPPGRIEDGQLLRGLKNDGMVFQDEITGALPAVIERQNGLLAGDKWFEATEIGGGDEHTYKVPDHFFWVSAGNVATYEGRNLLSRAFMNRVYGQTVPRFTSEELLTTAGYVAERKGLPVYIGRAVAAIMEWVNTQVVAGNYHDELDPHTFGLGEIEHALKYVAHDQFKARGWELALTGAAELVFGPTHPDRAVREARKAELAAQVTKALEEQRGQAAQP